MHATGHVGLIDAHQHAVAHRHAKERDWAGQIGNGADDDRVADDVCSCGRRRQCSGGDGEDETTEEASQAGNVHGVIHFVQKGSRRRGGVDCFAGRGLGSAAATGALTGLRG